MAQTDVERGLNRKWKEQEKDTEDRGGKEKTTEKER
jgi:hypothetical protein